MAERLVEPGAVTPTVIAALRDEALLNLLL